MQARMIGRRVPSGSMTIVGDLGQASGEHSARRWDDVVAHLPTGRRPARVVELSVNYRTPSEVMDLAGRVLAEATPGLSPPRSVRSTGEYPQVTAVLDGAEGLTAAAAEAARRALAHVEGGRVAVIAPAARVDDLAAALGVVPAAGAGAAVLEQPIAVYPVDGAKGLEFDAVVVVEPAEIVAERRNGLRALYVALTRTTRSLHLVHHRPLPALLLGLGDDPGGDQRGVNGVP
jgi:DNA helicase IV